MTDSHPQDDPAEQRPDEEQQKKRFPFFGRENYRDLMLVLFTAFLTTFGTTLAEEWVPAVSRRLTQKRALVIQVTDEGRPLSDVFFVVESLSTPQEFARGHTDERGVRWLQPIPDDKFHVRGVINEVQLSYTWFTNTVSVKTWPHQIILERRDFKIPPAPSSTALPITPLPTDRLLLVLVKQNRHPLPAVEVTIKQAASEEVLATAVTNQAGVARLHGVPVGTFVVEAVAPEGVMLRKYVEIHTVTTLPHKLALNLETDFSPPMTPAPTAPLPIASPTPSPQPSPFLKDSYERQLLAESRQVKGVLEIDWLQDTTPRDALQVETSAGLLSIKKIFDEVGIDLEVNWNDQLPANVMGNDGKFNQRELINVMEEYRTLDDDPDTWHFYLIFGGVYEHSGVQSIMFDTEQRRAAVVFTEGLEAAPQQILHGIVHEIGHMLNLPHPFQTYGDTRSVMSFPSRWDDWSWDDPTVYRFDAFGQLHIQRAPEEYVRPGGSAFFEYGGELPWEESQGMTGGG